MPRITEVAQQTQEENVLPSNTALEKEVLGHVLINGKIPPALSRDSFQLHDHQRVFDGIDNVIAAGKTVDRFSVQDALGGVAVLCDQPAFDYLTSLDGIFGYNFDHQIEILNDLMLKRKAITVADLIATGVRLSHRPTSEILSDAAAKFRELAEHAGPTREAPPSAPQWPSPMGDTALIGIAGDVVRLVGPYSEGDPAALLAQFLIGFGNLIGRHAHYRVESDDHHTAEYVVIVGTSAKARKGTSWGRIQYILSLADKEWVANCLVSGVGSGESLIDEVAEESHGRRRLILEGEFARVLNVLQRDGSTMSPILRSVWDSGAAAIRTRTQKSVRVTDGHLSLIAHITIDELRKKLADVELSNGLVNRALFVLARRSKELPFGAELPDCSGLQRRLVDAVRFGSQPRRYNFDADAAELWRESYSDLSRAHPGLLGSICARAEAHCIRLAIIYAVLDSSPVIQKRHLLAAMEVWRYAQASAAFVWGDSLGDPVADGILAALRSAPDGMTRWDLMNLFHRHKSSRELDLGIATLTERSLIRSETEETTGRPVTRFWSV